MMKIIIESEQEIQELHIVFSDSNKPAKVDKVPRSQFDTYQDTAPRHKDTKLTEAPVFSKVSSSSKSTKDQDTSVRSSVNSIVENSASTTGDTAEIPDEMNESF